MFLFRPSDKELRPHRRLVKDSKKSLEKILIETNKLNKFNWLWKGRGYEQQLDKATSKLESWKDMLKYQNISFQKKVTKDLKEDIDAIEILIKQIEDSFTKKGWLKDKVEQYQPLIQKLSTVAKIVSVILAIFGIELGGLLLLTKEAAASILPGN